MQFQVPQFIESEDKIVGPFSLRQFIYVAAAGGVSAALYFSVGGFVWVFGSLIVFALAGAMAFVKIEGRPFLNVILAAANFYWKPQLYIWQPEHPAAATPKARTAERGAPAPQALPLPKSLAAGSALHRVLSKLQTGERGGKESDKEFLERKMETRYQIFQRQTGEQRAAKRIDYR
jgi:PrgI family protein